MRNLSSTADCSLRGFSCVPHTKITTKATLHYIQTIQDWLLIANLQLNSVVIITHVLNSILFDIQGAGLPSCCDVAIAFYTKRYVHWRQSRLTEAILKFVFFHYLIVADAF
jgi:hypothetical protein